MNFSKTYLASLLAIVTGVVIIIPVMFIAAIGWFASLASSQEVVPVKNNSVLKISLSSQMVENASPDPMNFDLEKLLPVPGAGLASKIGLFQVVQNIEKAKEDDRINGIYLTLDPFNSIGWASLSTIREALVDFKSSGKFIYSYAEIYTEPTYYLASVSDGVYMPHIGGMEFNGLSAVPMFYKGLFDKTGIKPKIFKVGTFKSAVEPYFRKSMSPESKLQTNEYLSDFWEIFRKEVAEARSLSPEKIDELATNLIMPDGNKATEAGLMDGALFEDEVLALLKEKNGQSEDEKLSTISMKKYMQVPSGQSLKKNKIAIVFAEGIIVSGKSSDGNVGSETIVKELRKARNDENVKAIVLRVNSPGGSALASEMMAREVKLCSEKKPTIISMGNLAASGGYYISAYGDKIFAQENTITGSIGIFGVLYDGNQALNEKLGLTFDEVSTHANANVGDPRLPWTKTGEDFMQRNIEKGYGNFISVVKEGRGFADSLAVDKIAQGRVWSGKDAIEINLVDEIGNLYDAIEYASEQAGVTDEYRLQLLPVSKSPFEEIMGELGAVQAQQLAQELDVDEELKMLKQIKKIIPESGTYALMPMSIEIR
ncbi:MAG: signal peptide peptidase SppA [Bacteroidia bacterium]|nr:signal peptide peptidase SppA [Bacteroidia bacterium]